MKKIRIFLFLIILILSLTINKSSFIDEIYAYDINDYIRVGIRSGDNAMPLVQLSSDEGLELGYYQDEEFNTLMDFSEYDNIYVRNDSYFLKSNNSFYEYIFNENKDRNNNNIQGPIHIQLNGSFNNKDEAQDFIKSISSINETPYLVYDGDWKVWIGDYTTYNQAELTYDEIAFNSNFDMTVISKNNTRVQVTDTEGNILFIYYPSTEELHFKNKGDSQIPLVSVDNKKFRGNIIIKKSINNNLLVINYLTLDEYLYGVVPLEMEKDWPLEALKAQAIAARNFVAGTNSKHQSEGFDVCSTFHCQVYGGYNSESLITNQAVDETSGIIMLYDNKPIQAYYHSHSGGHTEDSQNVWSSEIDYIKGVEDQYSKGSNNDNWQVTFTKSDIKTILRNSGYNIGDIKDVYISEYSNCKGALKLTIEGTTDTIVLEKSNIRNVFGYNKLKSTNFEILNSKDNSIFIVDSNTVKNSSIFNKKAITRDNEIIDLSSYNSIHAFNGTDYKNIIKVDNNTDEYVDEYVFRGSGFGHRIGMSQWGAKIMAEEGFDCTQILKYYYTGIELTNIQNN